MTRRQVRVRAAYAAAVVLVAAASIAVALTVTPSQQVVVLGQQVSVSAAPSLSLTGPGAVDLFGQRLPTVIQFTGPVRPLLALTHITLSRQVAASFSAPDGGGTGPQQIGHALAGGWVHYFVWEMLITAGCALALAGAVAGWLRWPARRTLMVLLTCLVLTEAVNAGAIMAAAWNAPAKLRAVSSLTALVGQARLPAAPEAAEPVHNNAQAVVLGDSTAAGLGLPTVAHPGKLDRACHRSKDAFAADLAAVNRWQVLNLACSGATIPAGLLEPQKTGKTTVPAQLSEAVKVTHASVVIVSIGANDVGWSGLLRLCAVASRCDNRASTAYFQQQLATFTTNYFQLLGELASLPSHPRILVNQYYDPFGAGPSCLKGKGLTAAKEKSLISMLGALNTVLAKGAHDSAQLSVKPDFTGHTLCDADPYVQGAKDPAPFHPTAAGQLAIALADEQALHAGGQRVSAPPTAPSG
jgi:lysophospholipase L1-like esterase